MEDSNRYQAAEILGISDRQMRRWKVRYERQGYDGLFDRRHKRPSPRRVSVKTVQAVLRLYRSRMERLWETWQGRLPS